MLYVREVVAEGNGSLADELNSTLDQIQRWLHHKVVSIHESTKHICGSEYKSFIIICDNGVDVKFDRDNDFRSTMTQDEYTIEELKSWLYQIAFNNTSNDFGNSCVEIINRIDGFQRYVKDTRAQKKENSNE